MSNEQQKPQVPFSSKGRKTDDAWVEEINLENVKVMEGFNPRGEAHEKEIETLADSISKNGLINPPTVRPTKTKGEFELIAGHRRFRALVHNGRTSAPFVVRTDLDEDMTAKAYAVAENSEDGRTSLTYVELGRAFKEFDAQGWGKQKIASAAGVHPMTVGRAMKLMEAPEEVLDLVNRRVLSESAALAFAKLDAAVQNILLSEAFADKLEGASAHYIKELAKQAQKQLKAPEGEGTEGEGAETEAGGKKKGTVKVNWRTPSERTAVIRELAHLAYNPKNDGADEAREQLATLYWVRGHGEKLGDLSKKDMDTLIKGDNEAYLKAVAYAADKEAKKREKEEAKEAKGKEASKPAAKKKTNKRK